MVYFVEKPWGSEEIWAKTEQYVGKVLTIRHGHRLSLQYHEEKEETIRVLRGTLKFILDKETIYLSEGQTAHVPPKTIHRMEAHQGDVIVLEVSTPQLHDVVRLSDDYQRA